MTTQAEFEGDLDELLLSLDDTMADLLAKATAEQKLTLIRRRDSLRDIFWKSKASSLRDFNDTVEHLAGELKTEIGALKDALEQLNDIVAVINRLTEVIKLAGAIVATAAAA